MSYLLFIGGTVGAIVWGPLALLMFFWEGADVVAGLSVLGGGLSISWIVMFTHRVFREIETEIARVKGSEKTPIKLKRRRDRWLAARIRCSIGGMIAAFVIAGTSISLVGWSEWWLVGAIALSLWAILAQTIVNILLSDG